MSDQEKNLQDEELDKVSGGSVSNPILVNRSTTERVEHDPDVRSTAIGEHRIPPP
jgi:hypothetical protein